MADHLDQLLSIRAQVCVLQQALEFHETEAELGLKVFSTTCFAIENQLNEILDKLLAELKPKVETETQG